MLVAQVIGPGLQLDGYYVVIGFATVLVGSIGSGTTYMLPARIRSSGETAERQATVAGNGLVATAAVGMIGALASVILFFGK